MNKEQQFKQLIDENKQRILSICHYYAPTREDEQDMYQEILINIWKSLETFRGDSSIRTWIYRVAVNTSLSFTGKAFKRMKLNVDADVAGDPKISIFLHPGHTGFFRHWDCYMV